MSAAAKMDTNVTKLAMVEFFTVKFIMFAALFLAQGLDTVNRPGFYFAKASIRTLRAPFFPAWMRLPGEVCE